MSNKDRRSRLEKLLCILEDSNQDQTLRLAAQKIADVALQQPHHIPSVLRQVHQKLYSREWKARVYAGDVLADLAQRVEHCTADCLPHSDHAPQNRPNALVNFSLKAVLLSGTTLLSGNQGNEPEALSFDEVRAQLSTIKAQFALYTSSEGTHAGGPITDSVVKLEASTGEDLLSRALKRKRCETEKEANPTAAALEADASQHNIQSARERNRLKRQVKSVERQASGMLDSKWPSVTLQPSAASEHSTAAADEQESERIANGGWPFQRVADQLVANLLDANWQVRHGAAVGLRQLLRAQASCAAVHVPIADPLTGWRRRGGTGPMERSEMTLEQQRSAVEANCQWLQDTMAILLVLLVLDRFADYHNDSATAPVRETAAQAIAFAAAASPQAVRQQLLEQLIDLQLSQVWEVRHGSMMCIKCIMAVDTDAAGAMVHRILPVLMQGMRDSDDDVRASAVQACVPLADTLVQKTPGMVSDLITCLWELLPSFDEVSPAPASVLQLLGILTTHCLHAHSSDIKPDVPAAEAECPDGAVPPDETSFSRIAARGDASLHMAMKQESKGMVEQCLDHDHTSPDIVSYLQSFTQRMPLLWPFFDHSSTQVRSACVACCTRALRGLLPHPEFLSHHTTLQTMLRLTYQVFVAAADPELFNHCEELLLLILEHTPKHTLAEVLDAAAMYALMDLPCTPLGAPLPPVRLLRFAPCVAANVNDRNGVPEGLGGIVTFKFGEQNCDDTENAATARRIACARIVGLAASATASVDANADTNKEVLLAAQNFSNLIATYLYSNVALQRSIGALVMMSWMQLHANPSSVIPESLNTPLFKALEDAPTVPLQDTAAPMQVMHGCLAQILEAFSVAGSPIQLPPEVSLQSVTTVYATDILNSLDATYGDLAVMQRQACRDAVSHAESVDRACRVRLSAVVAAACVACQQLPEKVSSVIQPLMAGLRSIQEPSLQKQVIAVALANVITMCIDRKPAAVDKVLLHLRTFACTNTAPQTLSFQSKTSLSSASLTSFPNSPSATPPPTAYACGGPNNGAVKPPEMVAKEGAESVLQHVVTRLGVALPERLQQLWTMVTSPVTCLADSCKAAGSQPAADADMDAATSGVAASCFATPLHGNSGELSTAVHQGTAGSKPGHMREAQAAADAMQLLHCIAPALHVQLHAQLAGHVGHMMMCLVNVPAGLRGVVCGGIVQLTLSEPSVHLDAVVTALLPCLEAGHMQTSAATCERSAGTLLLAQLLAAEGSLMVPLLPYAALLTVPTLVLMTDVEMAVRTTAAAAFGRLMSILPMAVSQPLPELATLDATLRAKRESDLQFLEQLMNSQSVAAFDPPATPHGVTLRAYQREGVSWLAFLQKFGLHGVLADDMGLGKTVQTLTIIACSMVSTDALGVPDRAAARGRLPSLIVCPATLLGHWIQETKRYFGHIGLQTVRYQGSSEQRQSLQRQVRGGVLVVASYESVRADALWFAGLRFQYCALDEGHIIRNSKTKIVANHRLVLSGTPVQNNVTELWSLFDFLMPGYLGTESEFNSKYRRAATMSKDTRKSAAREKQMGSQLGALDSLHKQILPFVLRRTKEQVLDDLPPKIIQDIVCELTPLQHRLYEVAAAGTSVDPGAAVSSSRGQPGQVASPIFNVLQRLRKLCSHPSLMLDLQDEAHQSALSCSFPSLDVSNHAAVQAELSNIEQAPKLLALRQLLSNAGDSGQHRVLCFAQMKGTLDLVESVVLDPERVSYVRLDGDVSPAKRSDVVHRFNTDPTVDVMLLTTAAGCHGLNLTTANVVVFLEHDWNPMKDMQAMDRAHRLGQRRTVTVYRLLTEGTLEEHIMSLQQFKVDVANTVVNADNVAMGSMDTGAVLDLMSGSVPQPEGGGALCKQKDNLPSGGGENGGSQITSQPEQGDTVEEYNEFSIEHFMHTIRPKRK